MDSKEAATALFAVWDNICARHQEGGFEGLSRPERVFLSIWMLQAEVDNGGFCQYMFNSTGNHGEFVLDALGELGAGAVADVCRGFYALLPEGRPALTQSARQRQLDSAADALGEREFNERCGALERRFYALEDDLRAFMVAYARANRLM